ncbi:glutamate--cysteine ligase [Cellvibrio zantedeschiae]|uniref:glutamate--cysteine ligase n=1 Tax=Cellvibrio zantedeschiae TaxID=1237077 RepID=UPI00167374FB|nr:glutamate--cysteine ligase [Cellvibrio zantedeschiae]
MWRAHLAAFAEAPANKSLRGILRGLEKESLRITPEGNLAQTAHPLGLGSALKHPHITTDYSEALLEFITEPFDNIPALLQQLDDIHRFTYKELAKTDERLWPASMPSHLPADSEIPVARYGSSNSGTMKTIYRVGLGHRYGRSMQTIAGVHYNFSLPDDFWRELQQQEGDSQDLQSFKTQRYFALIRNFRRYFWLLVYLFGAAPAVSNNFVAGRKHRLQPLGDDTQHLPFATSLRMGDLGYQSDAQQSLFVCYNNVSSYLRTLCGAITHPHPDYETIGVKDEQGHYKQLNTSLLQIENEFYSSIRPKRTTHSGETALQALRLRGVEYIEVRCVDLNPYEPLGVSAEQLRVIDAFLLYCLLSNSPETPRSEYTEWLENQKRIVYFGRNPELTLLRQGKEVNFAEWAKEILDSSLACARLLDQANGGEDYTAAVNRQFAKVSDPSLTPSARVLADMHAQGKSFFDHTLALAELHRQFFAEKALAPETSSSFQKMASQSLEEQRELEQSQQISFDQYLVNYYQQYQSCNCEPASAPQTQNAPC